MKVKFIPQNVECEIKPGQSVMHAAQDMGLYIKSVCKGVPSCAECRVRVVEGDHHVLPPGSEELGLIGTGHFIDRRRLSCQLKCFGDITVDLSEQVAKQQGLIGGKKSNRKTEIKDDRIEDAHAIRSQEFEDETMRENEEAVGFTSIEKQPEPHRHQQPQQARQQQPQPQPRQQQQPRQPQQSRPQGPRPAPTPGTQTASGPAAEGGEEKSPDDRRPRRRRRRGGGGGGGPSGSGGSGPAR